MDADPAQTPVQYWNWNPTLGTVPTLTKVFASKYGPPGDGATTPAFNGSAEVVSRYCVLNVPVIDCARPESVTVWEIAPASDQETNASCVPAPFPCGVVVESV